VPDEVVAESVQAKPPLPVVCPVVSLDPPQGNFYEPATISIPYLTRARDEETPTVHLIAGTSGIYLSVNRTVTLSLRAPISMM